MRTPRSKKCCSPQAASVGQSFVSSWNGMHVLATAAASLVPFLVLLQICGSIPTSLAQGEDSPPSDQGLISQEDAIFNDKTIREATLLWLRNSTEAREKFGTINEWDTGLVTDMSSLFDGASSFRGNISAWNTRRVTTMAGMFHRAASFDVDLSGWSVASVGDMRSMFHGASAFDSNLSDWDTSSVWTMASMFHGASSFNGNVQDWNTRNLTNARYMFHDATSFDQSLCWDTSRLDKAEGMFCGTAGGGFDPSCVSQEVVESSSSGCISTAGSSAASSRNRGSMSYIPVIVLSAVGYMIHL